MDSTQHRECMRRLADDLAWLEDHCRKSPELSVHAAHLHLAAALVRNVLGPHVDGQGERPLHLAVIGGAGAGKSTVVNVLAGSVVADANPQAGFTRHPTAFVPKVRTEPWPSHLGFLGPLVRLGEDRPASDDRDVYQVKRFASPPDTGPFDDFAIWDCPDMTTWASANYVNRLMEVVALADLVVYVASDERYNDEVPTQFLHLVIRAGKPVVCCLTKMREADAPGLMDHFRREILGNLPASAGDVPNLPVVAIPNLPIEQRRDPSLAGAKFRVTLLNPLLALVPSAKEARDRTVRNAVKYLEQAGEGLLDVARRDLQELETWRGLVATGQAEFELRYRTEYLAGEAFARFDRTHDDVMALLELPGPARFVSVVLGLVRKPYEWISKFVGQAMARPAAANQGERAVCTAAMEGWKNRLQAESLRRTSTHPLWKSISAGFDTGLGTALQDQFAANLRTLEAKEMTELDAMARSIPENLAKKPILLNAFRFGIPAVHVAIAILFIALTWPPSWWLLLIIPAIAIAHQAVELIVKFVVDAKRNRLKEERLRLLRDGLTNPVAEWLNDWPASGGTSLQRLQLVLNRVPEAIRTLAAAIAPKPAAISSPNPPEVQPAQLDTPLEPR